MIFTFTPFIVISFPQAASFSLLWVIWVSRFAGKGFFYSVSTSVITETVTKITFTYHAE